MKCIECQAECVKNGRVKSTGRQRYYCKVCRRSFQETYRRRSYVPGFNRNIIRLIQEGCGTRSIARILNVSPNTVTRRIKRIASNIEKPIGSMGRVYQMDELIAYVGNKNRRICVAYAIDQDTRSVVDFNVGRRNKRTLGLVVKTLLLSESREIKTDRLNLYQSLIPRTLHTIKQRGINYIERRNLTLRTHIKRLNRRTIAYTKSLMVLSAILKIYFWG